MTISPIDRQNILNNEFAIAEIEENVDIRTVTWNGESYVTKEMLARYFDVDVRTIERQISNHEEELKSTALRSLKAFV